jgi:hypothetical protein
MFIDYEFFRIVVCAFIGAFAASIHIEVPRKTKLIYVVIYGALGVMIASPTCFFLSRFLDAPFEKWSHSVAGFGTWFLVWFLNQFKDHIKRWVFLIVDAAVSRTTKYIRGKE